MIKVGSRTFIRLTKAVLWPLCLAPVILLLLAAFKLSGFELGANPIEEILHTLGKWGLKFLLITLSITPLRRWTGQNWLISYRRMMGLFAFFFILLHFLVYLVLDQSLDMAAVVEDILERPYITLGMTGLILMLPLALTSTRGMIRRQAKWPLHAQERNPDVQWLRRASCPPLRRPEPAPEFLITGISR